MNVQVQKDQVWADKDKRRVDRSFEVVSVGTTFAEVDDGNRKTKIRLDRFKPKYYRLVSGKKSNGSNGSSNGASHVAKPAAQTQKPVTNTPITELSDACSKVLGGQWGGFGSYALLDNGKLHVLVRLVRTNCYDVKIRLDGHLVYSDVSRSDLDATLGQVRVFLKKVRDDVSDVV